MDTTHPGEKGSDHTRSHRPLAPHHAVSQAEDGRKDRTDEILDERELDKPAPKTNPSRISIKADLNPNGFQSNQIANQEFWLEGPRLQSPDAPRERLGTGSRSRGGHCKALYLEKIFLRFLGIDTAAVPLLKNPVSTCQGKVSSAPHGMSSGGDSQEPGPEPRSGKMGRIANFLAIFSAPNPYWPLFRCDSCDRFDRYIFRTWGRPKSS